MKVEISAKLHALGRSQSLLRAACFCASLLLVSETEAQTDYGQIAIDGMVQGILMPFTHGSDGAKNVSKSVKKQLFKPESKGKIETKDGSVKIDTKDPQSLEIASNFRKNYKKTKECQEPETKEINIKCANSYIKARKIALNQ